MVGAIFHGVVECYYIMGPDIPKDSNMEATAVLKTLEAGLRVLPPNTKLGHSLEVNTDNTAREAKNQYYAKFSSYLVGTHKFEAVQQSMQKTGHSHNEVDQRFSSAATTLKSAPELEDEEDFANWLREHLKPVRGRALHVEVLHTIMDFRAWLVPFHVSYSGLTACQSALDTCHSWRFVKRRLLGTISGSDADVVQNDIPEWSDLAPDDNDVVLILKESLSSTRMSQKPLLVLPVSVASSVDPKDLKPALRNDLGERTRKEYRKTATSVALEPWLLLKAQRYLNDLCDRNESMATLPHVEMPMLTYRMQSVSNATVFGVQSHHIPRHVSLSVPKPAEMQKRLGSTAKSLVKKRPAAAAAADSATK